MESLNFVIIHKQNMRLISSLFILLVISIPHDTLSNTHKDLQEIIHKSVDNKMITGASLCVVQGDSLWKSAAGNLSTDQTYFIASTTKIYVTAIILKLEQEGKLSLHDPIEKYLDTSIMKDLLVFEKIDYSSQITIKHLLSHTSGIPDYFQDKGADGKSLISELTSGKDQAWTHEQAIAMSKKIKPKFSPGEKDQAHYSDTNFQLLDLIIEKITSKKIDQVMQEYLFEPLGLKETYLYTNPSDLRPASLNYKKDVLLIPKAMTSSRGDGGIVSNTLESMTFLKAFMNGYFFPKEKLNEMAVWKKVMFPLEYGIGIMRFKLPKSMTGGKEYPELIGHSGLSGAFSFYCPEKDLYMTGTVNQIHKPGTSYKLLIKVMNLF